MRNVIPAAMLLVLAAVPPVETQSPAQGREVPGAGQHVLPERERPAVINRILADRLENLLPRLMRETGFDMWLVINREYMEDPVYLTLVPAPVFHARRLSMLVFHDRGEGQPLERLTVSRYPMQGYEAAWDGGTTEDQWKRLAEIVRERNPKRIGINVSEHWAFGDGLSAGLRDRLLQALGPDLAARTASAEALCVRWLETRTPAEMDLYAHMTAIARGIIAEAFSERVITPGVTTTDDVAWYIRQRITDLGLDTWFPPYVNRQYAGGTCDADTPFCGESGVIQRGDVLHTDVGISYLRLNTDTQEMGYVLRIGETDVPRGLRRALANGNRWQDLLTREFVTGRTGDEVFERTRAAAAAEGLLHKTYTHPVGFHGHAAGPMVGMWDNQGPVPVAGAWPLHPHTAYAIEGDVKTPVPEWNGQLVQVKLEQTALFDGQTVRYAAGRQTTWHVIR
ncbi:MAG TPA: M24 family metallopeptidase [Vicinamibacterales bacterium]